MKVFCIGLNKTGTISLHEALATLGFRSLHWGGPQIRITIERALEAGRPLVDDLGPYDAFSDILVLSEHFDVLDEQYPASKFVLNTRPLDDWIDSRRRHVERNVERHARGEYHGTFLTVDPDGWTAEYVAHHARVRAYFADRPDDLLTIDISAGDGYELLCPFLGRPVPDTPFPWRHRNAEYDP